MKHTYTLLQHAGKILKADTGSKNSREGREEAQGVPKTAWRGRPDHCRNGCLAIKRRPRGGNLPTHNVKRSV